MTLDRARLRFVSATAFADDVTEQRDRLLARLSEQRDRVAKLWAWYRGRQELPDVPAKYATAYRLFLEESATPWARLVVDAIAERLRVQGFRDADNPDGAREAWRSFTRSRLNADQRLVYTEALIGGTGYVSVGAAESGEVFIVPESSFEVTHEPDLSDRAVVAGALKMYPLAWDGRAWVAELYRPEATYRWLAELQKPPRRAGAFPIDEVSASRRLEWDDVGETPNEHGVVPVIPFENRVNVLTGGQSEIEDCVPILRRIDRLTLDMLVTSHFGSFRQKWATGLVVPRDPDTGQPVEPYQAAVSRLWVNEKADGRFGTFEASPPDGHLAAIDSQIASLAAISRVPAHYLMQRNLANPPSAESLVASESGLASKVEDRQAQYGEAWEQAVTLQAVMSGREVDIEEIEVDWVNAERRNPAQTSDSAIKLQSIGVPQPALWSYVGFTPQQVEEFSRESAASALLAAATAVPTTPAPATPPA